MWIIHNGNKISTSLDAIDVNYDEATGEYYIDFHNQPENLILKNNAFNSHKLKLEFSSKHNMKFFLQLIQNLTFNCDTSAIIKNYGISSYLTLFIENDERIIWYSDIALIKEDIELLNTIKTYTYLKIKDIEIYFLGMYEYMAFKTLLLKNYIEQFKAQNNNDYPQWNPYQDSNLDTITY